MSHDRIGAVIMAAGAGRRMGGRPKSLLMREGVSLIERQLYAMADTGIDEVAVVLGHHVNRIEALLKTLKPHLAGRLDLKWGVNQHPDDGPGSSLRTGLAMLSVGLRTMMVALADQPLVGADEFEELLNAWRSRGRDTELVVPVVGETPGHPLVFSGDVRVELMAMPTANGLRHWRDAHPTRWEKWVSERPHYTLDVDSEEDLKRLEERFGVRLSWPEDAARDKSE